MDGNNERLLTPGEVAALFRVDPKTVTRWAASGRITSIRTPGGHRRFRESEVRALLRGDSEPATASQGLVVLPPPVTAPLGFLRGQRLLGQPQVVGVLGPDLHVHVAEDTPVVAGGGLRDHEVPVRQSYDKHR